MRRFPSVAFYLLVIAALTRPLTVLLRNLRILKRLEDERPPEFGQEPSISVLIPARDESETLPRCLHSLRLQTYPHYSVTVLDDGSSDSTAEVVQQVADRDGRFHLVSGQPLPEGWVGKPWACQQLADQATGDILLFIDADTWFTPDVLARVAGVMQREQPGLLSAMPHQETGTIGERIVLPGLYMLFLCGLPLWRLEDRNYPDVAAANGQFICMRRSVYDQIGGHRAVSDRIVEDLALARITKVAGHTVVARTAIDSIHCRMYRSSREVMDGFSKNAFATFEERPDQALLGVAVMSVTHIVPPLHLAMNFVTRHPARSSLLPAIATGLGLTLRWLVSRRTGFRERDTAFAHVNALAYVIIVFRSMWWRYSGSGYSWKGRTYKRSGSQS